MIKKLKITFRLAAVVILVLFTGAELFPGPVNPVRDLCCSSVHSDNRQSDVSSLCPDCAHENNLYIVQCYHPPVYPSFCSSDSFIHSIVEAGLSFSIWQPPE
ncbi:MAG: hypothetical protein Q7T72_12605 [Bacteroidales bacterium]|nr:hypothetical protein [Bacteroidales bacterium]MDP3003075.1 hypothetical protein [Bacteroidales bacterium]